MSEGTYSTANCPVQDFQFQIRNPSNTYNFPTSGTNCKVYASGIIEVWWSTGITITEATSTNQFRSGLGFVPQPEIRGSSSSVVSGLAFGNQTYPVSSAGGMTGIADLFLMLCSDNTCSAPFGGTGDYYTDTRIISIDSPQLFSTTTSPVTLTFTYNQSENNPSYANGYSVSFTNSLTREQKILYGFLDDLPASAGTFTQSTSTTLTSGTWFADVGIYKWNSQIPESVGYYNNIYLSESGVIDYETGRYFGIDYNDNIQVYVAPSISMNFASTSCNVNFTDFAFGDCMGYLFIPQSNSLTIYSSLIPSLMGKFPFSYVASIKTVWDSLEITTVDSPAYEYNLADLGIGSTTAMGNILPNFTIFSEDTVMTYFPQETFDILKALAAIAIWLTFFADVFFTVRNMIRT